MDIENIEDAIEVLTDAVSDDAMVDEAPEKVMSVVDYLKKISFVLKEIK